VSAILEASIMTEGVETSEKIPSGSSSPGQGMGFPPTTFGGTEDFFPGDPLGDSSAIPPSRGSFFPLPNDPSPAAPPANAGASSHSWTSPWPPLPQSPGAVLVKEFDALYHRYERRVYRQCYHMLGNQEDAEDMTQEVFLRLFQKAHTFRGESSFSTWLHRLTVNTVLMHLRRCRRWREAVSSLDVAPGADEALSDVLTRASALPASAPATLDKIGFDVAIAGLSSGYQEIFLLHDIVGYRHNEIAKLLGVSEGTSKSQLHKARLRLRALLGLAGGSSAGSRRAPAVREGRKKRSPAPRAEECVLA